MDEQIALLAEASKKSSSEIVRLVWHVMAGSDKAARDAAFEETQETILALIAAVLTSDGATTHHAFVFAGLVAKELCDPIRCRTYLDDYTARWKVVAGTTPRFISTMIEYDTRHQTTMCRDVIRELKKLAMYAADIDGVRTENEARTADAFLNRLERLFRGARWTVRWDDNALPAVPLDATVARNEFRQKEIITRPPDARTRQ